MAVDLVLGRRPGLVLASPGGASFTIPVKGQKLVLPTEDNTKLIGNNQYVLDTVRYAQVAPKENTTVYSGPNLKGDNGMEFINTAHATRIRQTGIITKVKFGLARISNITEFRIKIWRHENNTYTVISSTDNLVGQLTIGINTIILSNGLTAQIGDYYGFYLVTSDLYSVLTATTGGGCKYFKPSAGYNVGQSETWATPTSNLPTLQCNILLYMTPPTFAFIGDSICAGHPANNSFLETVAIDNLNSSFPDYVRQTLGLTYQNMGIGGNTTTQIAARFVTNVIDLQPVYAIIEGGVNDVSGGASSETILTNYENMIIQCIAARITPIIFLVLPWHDGTLVKKQQIDYINSQLIVLASEYNLVYLDFRDVVGYYDPELETWDVDSAYNADGVHFTEAGYIALGAALCTVVPTLSNFVQFGSADLLNLAGAWLAVVDSSGAIEYYIFTDRPASITAVKDNTGEIFELSIDPGNSQVFRGVTYLQDQITDTDTDLIPDFLDKDVAGSLAQILYSYGIGPAAVASEQFVTSDGNNFVTSNIKNYFVESE